MQNVRSDTVREQSGPGPRSQARQTAVAFRDAVQDYLHINDVGQAEDFLAECSHIIDEARKEVRKRREALMSEHCAICGNTFEQGRPAGNEKIRRPGEEALNVYACSNVCFAQLQHAVARGNLKMFSEDFDQSRTQQKTEHQPRKPTGRAATPV